MNKLMRRNIGIDLIRGLSAILIVAYHYTSHFNISQQTIGYHTYWPINVWWGCLAVITFFLMSSYLSSSKMVMGGANLTNILKKRLLRLYPTFWVCMFITAIIVTSSHYNDFTLKDILLNLTMLPSLLGAEPIDGVYWTQQYELIYLFFLLLIIYFNKYVRYTYFLTVWLITTIALYYLQCNFENFFLSFFRIVRKHSIAF